MLAGPYATMLLADLGARVVKVERPGRGDDTRDWGPPFVGPPSEPESAYFLAANRNKESIALDFADPDDRAVLLRLVARADVVVENFRPGALARHGLDPHTLRRRHPGLVVCSVSGFGPDGPEAARPGYDHILQGEGGLMSVTGPGPGQPVRIGVPVVDILAGTFAALGVLAALHERERTGLGQAVHASLLGAAVASHVYQGARWLLAGEVPVPLGNRHPTIVPYGAFRCGDRLIQIAVGTEAMWARLAALLALDPDDPRFRRNQDRVVHVDELTRAIEERLAARPVGAWLHDLEAAAIPCGEIRSMDEVYGSAQVASQGLVVAVDHPTLGPIRLPGPPLRWPRRRSPHRPPPRLDEHGAAIRAWLMSPPPSGDATGPGEWPELGPLLQGCSGRVALQARNLETGEVVAHRGDLVQPTASVAKLMVLVELFRQVEAGAVGLDQPLALRAEHRLGGAGVLHLLGPTAAPSVGDAARLMIVLSDNTATNALIDHLGGAAVISRTMQGTLGLPSLRLNRPISFDPAVEAAAPFGEAAPRDLVTLLERIVGGELWSPAASAAMLAILREQRHRDQAARYLDASELELGPGESPRLRLANKTGADDGLRSDAGVVEFAGGGGFVYAMVTTGCRDRTTALDHEASRLHGRIARSLVERWWPADRGPAPVLGAPEEPGR